MPRLERPVSLVAQVEQALRKAITEGVFADGRLPTEVQMAERFGVSRETVRRAAETLQAEGLLRKYRRRGTVVEPTAPTFPTVVPPVQRLLAYVQAEYRSADGRVEDVTRGIHGQLFEGAASAAAAADYEIIFRKSTAGELRTTIERLVGRYRAAGVIAASFAEEKALRRLGGRALPIVLLDHDLALPKTSSIRDDSAAGSRLAVEHLTQLGHKRIALAQWHRADLNPWRERGYREGLRAAGIAVRRRYEIGVEITPRGAEDFVEQLLQLEPRPTAVVCFNNTLARYIATAANAVGLSMPDDLSIVGCGGEEVLGLTSCQSDWNAMGGRAVQLLLRRLESAGRAIEHEQPSPMLQIGESSAPPSGKSRRPTA